jgi:hypothetical protein
MAIRIVTDSTASIPAGLHRCQKYYNLVQRAIFQAKRENAGTLSTFFSANFADVKTVEQASNPPHSGEHSFPFLLSTPSQGRTLLTNCRAPERTMSHEIQTGTSALLLDVLSSHLRSMCGEDTSFGEPSRRMLTSNWKCCCTGKVSWQREKEEHRYDADRTKDTTRRPVSGIP